MDSTLRSLLMCLKHLFNKVILLFLQLSLIFYLVLISRCFPPARVGVLSAAVETLDKVENLVSAQNVLCCLHIFEWNPCLESPFFRKHPSNGTSYDLVFNFLGKHLRCLSGFCRLFRRQCLTACSIKLPYLSKNSKRVWDVRQNRLLNLLKTLMLLKEALDWRQHNKIKWPWNSILTR